MHRHESLHPLSRDHHEALVLARSLRWAAADDGAARMEALGELERGWSSLVALHFGEEEELLLPLLARADVERLLREHAALRALVEDLLARERDVDPGPEVLVAFAQALDDHIRWEERELFPRLEARTPAQALARLGERLRAIEATRPRSRGACEL